jgi:hypothetical protein
MAREVAARAKWLKLSVSITTQIDDLFASEAALFLKYSFVAKSHTS